jgi:prepilin-type N-terminal cleavage/methylation domain-containing protein
MNNNKIKLITTKGFTIIEVIIVLVVAAIIMLIVFLVVPQLQNSQRNTRRQNDARRILTAGEQFAANNNGTVPSCAASLTLTALTNPCTNITNITGDILTPTNGNYATVTAVPTAVNQIYIGPGQCGAGGATAAPNLVSPPANSLIVVVRQEPAGTFCLARQ